MVKRITVRYTIEGVPHFREFESIDEAEAFVTYLMESYGDEYLKGLTIETQE
jgi:hypothetical protein